jgi:hypothetical protein
MKDLSTKGEKRTRRPPIFHTNKELNSIAAKAGFRTIRELASAINRNEGVVGEYLRGEATKPTPLMEEAIAKALKISTNKLRTIVGIKTAEPSNPQSMAFAA